MKESKDHKEFKKSFRLEDLHAENIFKVPEGYFDKLPEMIQARVTAPKPVHWWQTYMTPANGWRVAFATVVVVLVLVFSGIFDGEPNSSSIDELLADVSLEDLIEYVEYSEISTEEILAEIDISEYETEFLMGDDIRILDEEEIDNLDMMNLYEEYGIEEDLF